MVRCFRAGLAAACAFILLVSVFAIAQGSESPPLRITAAAATLAPTDHPSVYLLAVAMSAPTTTTAPPLPPTTTTTTSAACG